MKIYVLILLKNKKKLFTFKKNIYYQIVLKYIKMVGKKYENNKWGKIVLLFS